MTTEQVNELLESYFAGETSLTEEGELRHYFLGDTVDPGLEEYRPLFAYWQARAEAPKKRARSRSLPRFLSAAAAALVLLFSVSTLFQTPPTVSDFPVAETRTVDWSKYEVTDPEQALRVIHATLKTASTELNRAPRAAARELRHVANSLEGRE